MQVAQTVDRKPTSQRSSYFACTCIDVNTCGLRRQTDPPTLVLDRRLYVGCAFDAGFHQRRLLAFRRRSPCKPIAKVQSGTILFTPRRESVAQAELHSYGVSPRSVSPR